MIEKKEEPKIEEIEPVGEVRQFQLVDKTPSAEEQEREEIWVQPMLC